jgi:uncharacterized protein
MTIDELLSVLRGALQAHEDLEFAVLFGSSVRRGPESARDVDIACSFRRSVPLLELGAIATRLEEETGRIVDLVDLADATTLLRWEVLQTGRLVLARDRDAWVSFQTRTALEWDDLAPFYELESAGLRRALLAKAVNAGQVHDLAFGRLARYPLAGE